MPKMPPMTKKQRDEYLARVKADRATPKEKPNVNKEILDAHKGNAINKELIRENAGNVEKVLELAKDVNTTKRYIKALENARESDPERLYRPNNEPTEKRADGGTNCYVQETESGKYSNLYYVEKKSFWGWCKKHNNKILFWGCTLLCPAMWATEGSPNKQLTLEGYFFCMFVWLGIECLFFAFIKFLDWIMHNKKAQRKRYEMCKILIAKTQANGMMVPLPNSKQDYYTALEYVAAYENDYPEEVEPYRLWLPPSEINRYNSIARNNGRKI